MYGHLIIYYTFLAHFNVLFVFCFYTLAEGIIISVRSLQRSEGDVSDPVYIVYIYI